MGCFCPVLLGGWPGGLGVAFCGPMGCCFSGVIAFFIGIAAPLIFFADVFKLPRMAGAVVLGIVVILEVLSLGGSWWAAWVPSWVAHPGEGA